MTTRPPASAPARSSRRAPRGVSLLEGLAAMAILLIGLLGTLQGITVAATQNSTAGKMSRGASIARETRVALELRGRAEAMAGPLAAGTCTTSPAAPLTDYADPSALAAMTAAGISFCVTDFDAFEPDTTPVALAYVPGYTQEERDLFRRVLIYVAGNGISGSSAVPDQVQVVVSFRGSGRRIYSKQFFALYDTTLNQAGVEL